MHYVVSQLLALRGLKRAVYLPDPLAGANVANRPGTHSCPELQLSRRVSIPAATPGEFPRTTRRISIIDHHASRSSGHRHSGRVGVVRLCHRAHLPSRGKREGLFLQIRGREEHQGRFLFCGECSLEEWKNLSTAKTSGIRTNFLRAGPIWRFFRCRLLRCRSG